MTEEVVTADKAGHESFPASDSRHSRANTVDSGEGRDGSRERRVMDDPDMGEDEPSGDEAGDDDGPNADMPPAFDPEAP